LGYLSKYPLANYLMHTPPGKNSPVENPKGISGGKYGIKNIGLNYTALKVTRSLRDVLAKFLTYLKQD
jgi:hypothetical protein